MPGVRSKGIIPTDGHLSTIASWESLVACPFTPAFSGFSLLGEFLLYVALGSTQHGSSRLLEATGRSSTSGCKRNWNASMPSSASECAHLMQATTCLRTMTAASDSTSLGALAS